MTFQDAAEILDPYPLTVDYPPRRRSSASEQREIYIQMADGTRRRLMAYVMGNFGILRYQKNWHVIHIHSENSIFETAKYQEAEDLVLDIIRRKIDTNWGYRDLHTFKSILQLIGVRKMHKQRSYGTSAAATTHSAHTALPPLPPSPREVAAAQNGGDQQ